MDKSLTGWEQFWYYLSVISSFGGVFFLKVLIKKAIIDSNRYTNEYK